MEWAKLVNYKQRAAKCKQIDGLDQIDFCGDEKERERARKQSWTYRLKLAISITGHCFDLVILFRNTTNKRAS